MIELRFHYDHAVATLPVIPPEVLERATVTDLRLLMCLAMSGAPLTGDTAEATVAAIAAHCHLGQVETAASLAFWRGTGILDMNDGGASVTAASRKASKVQTKQPEPSAPTEASPTTVVRKATSGDQIPQYSATELADLLESRAETKANIDECQRIWGKIFNYREINILLVLSDYLGLDWDYIMSLLARCASDLEKQGANRSMHYVEKTALSYYDEGIRTLDELQEKFRRLDTLKDAQSQLRTLFGMGDRRLTPRETKFFSTWLYDFQYDLDIIRMAYDVTVDIKGDPNMAYMNSVLSNWNRDGLRTPADIEAHNAAYRAEQEKSRTTETTGRRRGAEPATPSGSFDTDDFFGAAVRRSLGEDFNPTTISSK